MRLVRAAECGSAVEAHELRRRLEARGIHAEVRGELVSSWTGASPFPGLPAEVWVEEPALEAARTIVDVAFDASAEDAVDLDEEDDAQPEEPQREPEGPVISKREAALELLVVFAVFELPQIVAVFMRQWSGSLKKVSVRGQLLGLAWDVARPVLLAYLVHRNKERFSVIGFRKSSWVGEGLLGIVILVVILLTQSLAMLLARGLRLPWWQTWGRTPSPGSGIWWILPFAVVLSAIDEEVFYRAYLWSRLSLLTGSRIVSLFISAAFFALVHAYSPAGTFGVFVFGLVLGLLYCLGRSVPRLVVAHALFNLFIYATTS